MGRLNRFRALKNPSRGFTQITGIQTYKHTDDELVGEGLCAAISMRWLQSATVPDAREQIEDLATLQKAYETKLKDENYKTGPAIELLADRCDRRVARRTPVGPPDEAISYWQQRGRLGTAIQQYASGALTNGEDGLPCYSWLNLYIRSLNGVPVAEILNNKDRYPEFAGLSNPNAAHGVALSRQDGGYRYCDPNAGVYDIAADGLASFFHTVAQCYEMFYNQSAASSEDKPDLAPEYNPDLALQADVDLQLVRIYHIEPKVAQQ